jgi:hypothetical protein
VYSIGFSSRWEPVYNLHIADTNTYFVGSGRVGAHNCAGHDPFKRFAVASWARAFGYSEKEVLVAIEQAKKTIRGTNPKNRNPDIDLFADGSMVIKGQPKEEAFDNIRNWLN